MGAATDLKLRSPHGDDSYRIDRVSQKMLVYLHEEGPSTASEMRDAVGVEQEQSIHYRYNLYLGPDASGAVQVSESRDNPGCILASPVYALTEWGEHALNEEFDYVRRPKYLCEVAEQSQAAETVAKKALEKTEKYASNRYVVNERSKENRTRIITLEERLPELVAETERRIYQTESVSRDRLRQELRELVEEVRAELARDSLDRRAKRERERAEMRNRLSTLEELVGELTERVENAESRRNLF
jgi:hypothetical protein